ncbi:TraV family lipoprotein [Sphingomonas oryzagri]
MALSPLPFRRMTMVLGMLTLSGCAAVGSVMSPYPEKFGCKNSDHGVCIAPNKAYEDAVAGRVSTSDPAVTNDKKLLHAHGADQAATITKPPHGKAPPPAFAGYRDSVYAELRGLLDQPATPMLKAPRTVRTLILPYADRQRPDRLYMPRYVYSILERPEWVVGDYLVDPASQAAQAPVLGQVHEKPGDDTNIPATLPTTGLKPVPEMKP